MGLIVGGRSHEHEVSLASGCSVASHINKSLYNLRYFYIDKRGEWHRCSEYPESSSKGEPLSANFSSLLECDLLFPLLHGTNGEDGTIQGFFEMLNLPYVGGGHRSNALCMDKALTKRICLSHNIPTSPYVEIGQEEWKREREGLLKRIGTTLKLPLFVKACHLGSSIGVYKVEAASDLAEKIDQCFLCDDSLIVEEGIVGREIEFALLGNENPIAFPPGEVITNGKVYDYKAKYGEGGFPTAAAADLPAAAIEEGRKMALTCYRALKCRGLNRIDFFYDGEGRFWLNEMNPIPGFTKISLFPAICSANGLSYESLLSRLIVLALRAHRVKKSALFTFSVKNFGQARGNRCSKSRRGNTQSGISEERFAADVASQLTENLPGKVNKAKNSLQAAAS